MSMAAIGTSLPRRATERMYGVASKPDMMRTSQKDTPLDPKAGRERPNQSPEARRSRKNVRANVTGNPRPLGREEQVSVAPCSDVPGRFRERPGSGEALLFVNGFGIETLWGRGYAMRDI
jgi:hypothetical protein